MLSTPLPGYYRKYSRHKNSQANHDLFRVLYCWFIVRGSTKKLILSFATNKRFIRPNPLQLTPVHMSKIYVAAVAGSSAGGFFSFGHEAILVFLMNLVAQGYTHLILKTGGDPKRDRLSVADVVEFIQKNAPNDLKITVIAYVNDEAYAKMTAEATKGHYSYITANPLNKVVTYPVPGGGKSKYGGYVVELADLATGEIKIQVVSATAAILREGKPDGFWRFGGGDITRQEATVYTLISVPVHDFPVDA